MFHDDSIAGSWQELLQRIDATDAFGRWAADDARLAGLHDVTRDLLPLLKVGSYAERTDAILGALLRQAALDGGADHDALLLTLHLLSDWVLPLATTLKDLGPGMVGVIVSELTCQIHTFPWQTRSRAVATTLRWKTRHAVLAEFRPSIPKHRYRAEVLLDPMSREWEAILLGQVITAPDVDLGDLLAWAARVGVEVDDISLLVRTEQARCDASGRGYADLVAAELGMPRRTFFSHRARALNAVRAASRGYLAVVA